MSEKPILYISHLHLDSYDRPKKGHMVKPLFYTVREEKDGESKEYHYGTDIMNSFTQEEIDSWVERGILLPLREKVLLEPKKGIWVTHVGELIYADLVSPTEDPDARLLYLEPKLLEL